MINWDKISAHISDVTGSHFSLVHASPISGGCTNQAWHLEDISQTASKSFTAHFFIKLNSGDKAAMFAAESLGLGACRSSLFDYT